MTTFRALILLAAAGGSIEAQEIETESIVSGLQVLSERAATSVEEFRAQLGEVKQFMQRLNAALPPELSKDSAEIDELLEKSDKEAASEQPSAHRIKRWLQNINDIATQVKTNVKTFTAVSVAVQSLIRAVASLFG